MKAIKPQAPVQNKQKLVNPDSNIDYNIKNLITNKLKQHYKNNLYRTRINYIKNQDIVHKNKINFASNNYLGLANNKYIIDKLNQILPSIGIGSTGSNLITGYHHIHQDLESAISKIYNTEQTILFSSGYMANLAIADLLNNISNNSISFIDHSCHASVYNGHDNIRLNKHDKIPNKISRFKHNNIEHLELLLNKYKNYQNKFFYTESLFSMDGDFGEINQINNIIINSNIQNNSILIIDGSHSFGIIDFDKKYKINNNINKIIMGTFGKAIGTSGAFITGPKFIIEALIQFSKQYIYSTSISPIVTAASLLAIKYNINNNIFRNNLFENIEYFYNKINKIKFNKLDMYLVNNNSPIQPIIIGASDKCIKASKYMLLNNIITTAIRYPTVAINKARLRITITAEHSKQHIDYLINTLTKLDNNL